MLRGYYDGSGKTDQSEFLTLAGMIASESVWKNFEQEWGEILKKHRIRYLHMSEAMSLNRQFSKMNGWDYTKVDALIKEFWNVIGKFRAFGDFKSESNLVGTSCTVVMEDYRMAKMANPKLREPEAICTQFCFHAVPIDVDFRETAHPQMVLVFDRNESFLRTIYRNWVKYKNHSKAGWPKQIENIVASDSENHRPLQAADLLAWTMNKHHRKPGSLPHAIGSFIMLEHYTKTYDYETLMKQFPNG